MKVVYDNNEKEFLNEFHNNYPDSHMLDCSDPDRVYSLNFKITDPGVANHVLMGLLFNKLEDFDLGIKIMSINLMPYVDNYDLKQKIYNAIDEIIR